MKNQKKIREAIKQIKRELSNAQYFISQIKSLPKDKKTSQALHAADMTVKKIEDIISHDLNELEKDIANEETEVRAEFFKKTLGTINSPSLKMRKTAESFIEGSKQPNILMKKAMEEQIRKASSQNVKQAIAGN